MPRHPLVTVAYLMTLFGLLFVGLGIAIEQFTTPPAQGVNIPRWLLLSMLGTLLLCVGGLASLFGAWATRRGPRADFIGCLCLLAGLVVMLGSAQLVGSWGGAMGRGAAIAGAVLCLLLDVAGLMILTIRPGTKGPHQQLPTA